MSLRNRVGNGGLDDLFDESEVQILDGEKILRIPKDLVYADAQVRIDFNEESIKELSYNIEENGQLQPIIVFGVDTTGKHKIHQGERRWRAVMLSNRLTHIDCIVRNSGSIFQQLSENIQRENLNAIEIGKAIRNIKENEKLTGKEIADKLTISEQMVSMFNGVVDADDFILDAYRTGVVGDAHAINELKRASVINRAVTKEFVGTSYEITRKSAEAFKKSLSKSDNVTIRAEKPKSKSLAGFDLSKGQKAEMTLSPDFRNLTFKFNRLGKDANEILIKKIEEAMHEIEKLNLQ
ncbi:ParB/RepB/Spo0J family partition protein [Vibrio sp. Y29_XK_CS5]|uniref:ParB/RepB/Spo0J family partition protein n=1 Tax=Vibrio sp. Y29_XK_CS5 TaxID=2957762 RepID=UPI0020A38351|nr:ParB/RepB/Spo0J family partition protein [Vibrio sp. Y29_XK_CS5]